MTKVLVLYYSSYGHIEQMAKAAAEGVAKVAGVSATLKRVPETVPEEASLSLFRVLQEAVQNAAKYSGSRQFQVSLIGRKSEIALTVQDGGTGFDVKKALQGHGLGLTSMRERLKLVDGDFSIVSQPKRGTTVRARVPIGAKAAI